MPLRLVGLRREQVAQYGRDVPVRVPGRPPAAVLLAVRVPEVPVGPQAELGVVSDQREPVVPGGAHCGSALSVPRLSDLLAHGAEVGRIRIPWLVEDRQGRCSAVLPGAGRPGEGDGGAVRAPAQAGEDLGGGPGHGKPYKVVVDAEGHRGTGAAGC